MKNHIRFWSVMLLLLALMVLAACNTGSGETPAAQQPAEVQEATATEVIPTEIPPTDAPPMDDPAPTDIPEPTEVPPTLVPEPTGEPVMDPLPPEPQDIEFQSEDGQVLKGRYYPGATNPSPILVLMHWAPGNMDDWNEMAFWFQNRGLSGTSPNVGTKPYLDPTWFPAMPEGKSYAVFTFTFRGCEEGCSSFQPDGWRMDALAAVKTARSMDGVDPNLLATIGASIGADGAPDACGPINVEFPDSCWGALSFSPGSYLNVAYDDAVTVLMEMAPPRPVWCFYATGDTDSAATCKSAEGADYQTYEWEGPLHGMDLIDPAVDPNAMQLILDWLALIGW